MSAILAVSATVPVLCRYVHLALPSVSRRQRIGSSAGLEASRLAPDLAGKIVDGANRVLVCRDCEDCVRKTPENRSHMHAIIEISRPAAGLRRFIPAEPTCDGTRPFSSRPYLSGREDVQRCGSSC
jgi:hypothetical protein